MLPKVSIVVPCYNEQETIGFLLRAILDQTYSRSQMEVVIADGLSQDKTRDVIADFGREHPDLPVRVVDNTKRSIPSSLNLAIRVASGELIVRLDAHSIPYPDYVARCVQAIQEGKGGNVGGKWIIGPGGPGWIAHGIAAAAGHWLGAGDAWYRVGGAQGNVDTVPFGAFTRSLFERIGGFDEKLLTNEDYEFNARVRRSGSAIWFDPQIRSTYLARPSLSELARQYWRYGFWKVRMLIRYPSTLRWRQALPPLFVLSVGALLFLSALWRPALNGLAGEITLYALALLLAGIDIGLTGRQWTLVPGSILALATMHLAWGSGFIWSLMRLSRSGSNG